MLVFVLVFHSGAHEDSLDENLGVFSSLELAQDAASEYIRSCFTKESSELTWQEELMWSPRKVWETPFLNFGDVLRFEITGFTIDEIQPQRTKYYPTANGKG